MPTINEIAASIQTGSVTINGKHWPVRALSAAEVGMITHVFTEPPAPMGDDPTKGSAAPPIRRPDDPAYLRAHDAWGMNYRAAVAAVALGLRAVPTNDAAAWDPAALHTPAGRAAAELYLKSMVPQVLASLTPEVITMVRHRSVELGAGLAESAEKNSSTPAPTGAKSKRR